MRSNIRNETFGVIFKHSESPYIKTIFHASEAVPTVVFMTLSFFYFLQRNSQGLHGSKHRKHRRGSRKHSKGSKENSSAIEALVEQVNNSSSVILEAELQQQSTDDGSSSR